MDVGLALPQFDFSVPNEPRLRWETLVDWARWADGIGFESLWLADHLFWDIGRYGGRADRQGCFDPLVALGGLARATSRARLGTLVLCTPLRPAGVLAKALATLDVLSGGRLVVGLGTGWYEPELVEVGRGGERQGVRLERLSEAVEVLRGLFAGGPFSYRGTHHDIDEARCLPRPVQDPAPPIWLGGSGDRLLNLAARLADGWNTAWRTSLDDYRARARMLDDACERAARDPAAVTRSVGLYALVGSDEADLQARYRRLQQLSPQGVLDGVELREWREGRLVGTVEQVRDQLAGWEDAGVSSLVLSVGAVPFAVADRDDVALAASACGVAA